MRPAAFPTDRRSWIADDAPPRGAPWRCRVRRTAHVAKGAIRAGHDAIELAAALADADVEEGLTRYDAARRPASALVVAESRRLGAYIGEGERVADAITFMRENGGVER
jgi:hypothetical protein